MRVAIVHSYYSSRQPSGENSVVDAQAAALREYGFEVLVIGAQTDLLEKTFGYKARSALNVATGHGPSPLAMLEKFAPDIVHVHNLFPNWGTEWLDDWAGPIVATVHNFRPLCAAGTLFRDGAVCTLCPDKSSFEAVRHACYRGSKLATLPLALRSRKGIEHDPLLSRADRVILLSGRAQTLYSRYGIKGEKIVVIPNFVDDIGFAPEEPPGAEWVYIGRLSEEKGIGNLLKHWPETESLNIYGDGPLRSQVEGATRSNVKMHGRLAHDDVAKVLAGSRGMVFPSECSEGFPLAYVEALAAGRVVVAKTGNSAADDVVSSGSGLVFEAWSDLAGVLAEAGVASLDAGKKGRRRFEERYTPSAFLSRTAALYADMVEGRADKG